MFCSPCSLRSSSCAALIALATMAGLSRFEPASGKSAAASPLARARQTISVTSLSRAQFYPVAMQALAPQFRVSRPSIDFASDHRGGDSPLALLFITPGESWRPIAAPVTAPLISPAAVQPARSARRHSYPYAVGPPRCKSHKPLRAAGTEVPGDSCARRSQVSRIAPTSISIPSALLMHALDSGPPSAKSTFFPSSALRGEPAFLCRPSYAAAARARSGPVTFPA